MSDKTIKNVESKPKEKTQVPLEDLNRARVTNTGKAGSIISITLTSIILTIGLVFVILGSIRYSEQWNLFTESAIWTGLDANAESTYFDWYRGFAQFLDETISSSFWTDLGTTYFGLIATDFIVFYIPIATTSLVFVSLYKNGNGRTYKVTAGVMALFSDLVGGIIILSAKTVKNFGDDLPAWNEQVSNKQTLSKLFDQVLLNNSEINSYKENIKSLKESKAELSQQIVLKKMSIAELKGINQDLYEYVRNQELEFPKAETNAPKENQVVKKNSKVGK